VRLFAFHDPAIPNLIASTTTTKGLRVSCVMNYNTHPKGVKMVYSMRYAQSASDKTGG